MSPPGGGGGGSPPYISISERLLNVVRSLTLTNVLMLALLVVVAVPAYFAYRFITDEEFRHDFMVSYDITDDHPPCYVVHGKRYGDIDHHTVLLIYASEGRWEKVVGLRTSGELKDSDIETACTQIRAVAEELKK